MDILSLRRRRSFYAAFTILFLLSVPLPGAWGQETVDTAPIAETVLRTETDPTGRWGEVIRETVRLRLATAGLAEEALIPLSPPEEEELSAFLDTAEEREASFALVSDYDIDGNQISMNLSLYDVKSGELLASDTRRGRLDLELDEVILSAVDSVLSFAALELGLSPDDFRRSPEEIAASRPLLPAGTATENGATEPEGPGPDSPEVDGRGRLSIHLLTGASPFFPSGSTSTYFGIGIRPVINLLFGVPMGAGELRLGLVVEGNRMNAEGSLSSGSTNLVSGGPEVRYQSSSSNTLSVFVRVAGGATFLYFVSDNGKNLQEVIPYGSTGIGAGFLFSERFGIVAETGFAIYFEGDDPIMGFAPALQALWRL